MHGPVRWLAREVYADTRYHGVPETSLDERRRHLEDFQEHVVALVEAGPATVEPARALIEATYVPLFNAGYVAPGGDHWNYVSGHGNTEVSAEQMQNFISEQVYAIRAYALRRPESAPAGRIGFSWDPINRFGVAASEFKRQVESLTERLAMSIRGAYEPGSRSALGACTTPGTTTNWCRMTRPRARFTEAWEIFDTWD
jgi:hypothetical protein